MADDMDTGDTSTSDDTSVAEEPSIDIEAAADRIGDSIFRDAPREDSQTEDERSTAPVASVAEAPAPIADPEHAVPKTWPTDMHAHWSKTPKEVQNYWDVREKQMMAGLEQYKEASKYGQSLRDIMAPYRPILAASGMDDSKAMSTLLNAHYRLTQGSANDRQAAYRELGQNLGFVQAQAGGQQAPVDPAYQALQHQISQLTDKLTSRETSEYEARRTSVQGDVEKFASDTSAHPHFDDVADDIIAQIRAGHSLQDAYDRAVFSNPVTREKEFARRQTADAKARETNGRQSALSAKKASSVNIRSRDSQRSPTESVGDMRDTLASTLASIRARTH